VRNSRAYIGTPSHLEQQSAAAFVLQIEGDRAFVRVEHRNRECRALAGWGSPTQGLAVRRLDLDDVGAGLRHQQRRIRSLEDLAEIKDEDAGKRQVGTVGHA
jgi:hypothetical protein